MGDTLDSFKIRTFCSSKEDKKTNCTDQKKVFTNHISDNRTISRMYNSQIQHKKTNNPLKMDKIFEHTFHQMANKH